MAEIDTIEQCIEQALVDLDNAARRAWAARARETPLNAGIDHPNAISWRGPVAVGVAADDHGSKLLSRLVGSPSALVASFALAVWLAASVRPAVAVFGAGDKVAAWKRGNWSRRS